MPVNTSNLVVKKIQSMYLSNNPPPVNSLTLEYFQNKFEVFVGIAMAGLQFELHHLQHFYSEKDFDMIEKFFNSKNYPTSMTCGIDTSNSVVFYPADPEQRNKFNTLQLKFSNVSPASINNFLLNVKPVELTSDSSLTPLQSKKIIKYLKDVSHHIIHHNNQHLFEGYVPKPSRFFPNIVCDVAEIDENKNLEYKQELLKAICSPQLLPIMQQKALSFILKPHTIDFETKQEILDTYSDDTKSFVINEDASLTINILEGTEIIDNFTVNSDDLPCITDMENFIADNIGIKNLLSLTAPVIIENFRIEYPDLERIVNRNPPQELFYSQIADNVLSDNTKQQTEPNEQLPDAKTKTQTKTRGKKETTEMNTVEAR